MADLSNNNGVDKSLLGEDAVRKAVESSQNSDESQDDDDDDDSEEDDKNSDDDSSGDDAAGDDSDDSDDDSDADEDEEDDDETESGDKKNPKSGRKFSQFSGDGSDKAYISNLEEGYKNSSAEAIRIKGELETASGRLDTFMRVVASNPELATAFNKALGEKGSDGGSSGGASGDGKNSEESGLENPFVENLKAEWEEKSEKEIQDILDANPELITDEALSNKVKHWMSVFSAEYRKEHNGRLMSGGDAMLQAMKHLGIEDRRGKQDLANGAKKHLTQPRSRGNKAKKSGGQKPQFTADQVAMAKAMGKDEAWLQKNSR